MRIRRKREKKKDSFAIKVAHSPEKGSTRSRRRRRKRRSKRRRRRKGRRRSTNIDEVIQGTLPAPGKGKDLVTDEDDISQHRIDL